MQVKWSSAANANSSLQMSQLILFWTTTFRNKWMLSLPSRLAVFAHFSTLYQTAERLPYLAHTKFYMNNDTNKIKLNGIITYRTSSHRNPITLKHLRNK